MTAAGRIQYTAAFRAVNVDSFVKVVTYYAFSAAERYGG